jgi:diguanylate cyclase (GGDEF)-like protein
MGLSVTQAANAASTEARNRESTGRVVPIKRGQRSAMNRLENFQSATSALRAVNAEYGDRLRELDEISEILKSDYAGTGNPAIVPQPAVWLAIKQALLERELRHLGLTDELTGLFNRRGFFAAATQMVKMAIRNRQNLVLLSFRVDNLKQIVQSCGQPYGDSALACTADALGQSFRGADVLAHTGEGEFTVLAVEASSHARRIMCRRFQAKLKEKNAKESQFRIAVTFGAARFDPRQPVSLGELILRASKSLGVKRLDTVPECGRAQ